MTQKRILIYVQHLLGIGHFQRMLAIAHELIRRDCIVSMVNGGVSVSHAQQDFVYQLPPIQSEDLNFKSYITDKGKPVTEDYRQKRAEMLLKHMDSFNPNFLLIESFPFGRTYFSNEILPLLIKAQETKVTVACSIRDILVRRPLTKEERSVALLNQYMQALFIHSDEALLPLHESFSSVSQIKIPTHYTGYISENTLSPQIEKPAKPTIIVSAGGGIAGRSMIEAVIQMVRDYFKDDSYDFLIFSNHARDQNWISNLKTNLPASVQLRDISPDFRSHLQHAAASINQAGYNTVCDLIKAKCPSILIPFSTQSETEQKQRAEKLSNHPLFTYIDPDILTPQEIGTTLHKLLKQKSDQTLTINMSGIKNTCDLILSSPKRNHLAQKKDPWQALADEFAKWNGLETRPKIWYRDDDVSRVTPAFNRMADLFSKHQTPFYAAAIPGLMAGNDLAHFSRDYPMITFWQHGHDHSNHALTGQKKIELGGSWSLDMARQALIDGKNKLENLFGEKFEPIMVPPWNRIDTEFLAFTASIYEAISLFQNASPEVSFKYINCQIDLIDWKNQKSFIGTEAALKALTLELQKRRFGVIDVKQPIGILLHHLDHTQELTIFLERLLPSMALAHHD